MRKISITIAVLFVLLCGRAKADVPPLNAKSSVDDVLDALDSSGKFLKSFSADLKETEVNEVSDSEVFRFGHVWYQIDPTGKATFHTVLDQKQVGKKVFAEKRDYQLDNGLLTTRTYTNKNEVRMRLSPPGQKMNLFQLGKGPFPLPIGQDKQAVHQQFSVVKIDAIATDPPGNIHLQLAPNQRNELAKQYKLIDVWVDPNSKMPSRIMTTPARDGTEKTVDLVGLKTNLQVQQTDLDLSPLPADWKTSDQ